MLPSKTKTGLSETLPNKSTPATPRASKLIRGPSKSDSPSQIPRLSFDRSPRSGDSKPAIDRRSPKISTPDRQQRVLKGSELQAQLDTLQEDLKKAKERLVFTEKERVRVFEELKEAKKAADEANERLSEALVAQKRAEESSEIEKFRADELEQAGIEAAQKREDDWKKDFEYVRSQHALDVAALLSANQELQRIKHELAMSIEAKNTALSHADDAMKIAEINAEKVEILSSELGRVKALLDSKLEAKSSETSELVKKLNLEIDSMKEELEKAKSTEQRVGEMEAVIERLRLELDEANAAESNVSRLVEEWKRKANLLENQLEIVTQAENSASESLALAKKQFEENTALSREKELEVFSLKELIASLKVSIAKDKQELEQSNQNLDIARQETLQVYDTVESLKSEIEIVKSEKMQALKNEMTAASTVRSLLDEKNRLLSELDVSKEDKEKSKKAMESLASALHEVSTEVRETKEKLSTTETRLQTADSQIENLKLNVKASEEKYESLLDESKNEIECLKNLVEESQLEAKNLKEELDDKELNFVTAIKSSEEEILAVKGEMNRLASESKAEWQEKEVGLVTAIRESEQEISTVKNELVKLGSLLKEREEAAWMDKEDKSQLLNTLKQAESEANSAKEVAEKALAESLKLKERLLDKENELQSITQENEELRIKEASALHKVEELLKLLEEATANKVEENGELSNSGKDYDLFPRMDEAEETVTELEEEKAKSEFSFPQPDENKREIVSHYEDSIGMKQENVSGNTAEVDSAEVEAKNCNDCKIYEKDLSPGREHRSEPEPGSGPEAVSFEDEGESKIDGDSYDQLNGLSSETMENGGASPTKQQNKKKKPLLRKFGSLLKKKSNPK